MPAAFSEEQNPGQKSRPARERVLPVAQIYACKNAEAQGRSAMVTLVIGDEKTPPKTHGIRASHGDWCAVVSALAEADPVLGEQLREALRR